MAHDPASSRLRNIRSAVSYRALVAEPAESHDGAELAAPPPNPPVDGTRNAASIRTGSGKEGNARGWSHGGDSRSCKAEAIPGEPNGVARRSERAAPRSRG